MTLSQGERVFCFLGVSLLLKGEGLGVRGKITRENHPCG